jgi:NADPH-dependent curcumin reductase CurA
MGGLIIKTTHASCDSPLRGRMRSPEIKWAYPAFLSGEPVETYLLARVQKSNNPSFRVNDLVHGLLPLQEYTPISAKTAERLEVIHNPRGLEDNLFLGVLGLPGLTAYSSVYAIGKRKKGETIFISSAARAVGKIVGQLAKHEGFTVIGSVGSYEKLKFIVDDLGFDGGFNYKSETAAKALPRLAPQGLDIYYDNVGGEQLEAALLNMRMKGRISKNFYLKPDNGMLSLGL